MRALVRAGAAAVLALALTAPSSHAATQVHGSPLASPANGGWGCETAWLPPGGGFTLMPVPSGHSSCTYFTPGNSNSTSAFVPGNGTITKARVKSGPNPAPLSIVILRRTWLKKNGQAVDHTCCSVEAETAAFQPTPNAVTEVPVNLPVSTQPDPPEQGGGWHDLVGVTAHGPGELPVASVGPHTLQAGTQQGILMAIGFYPRIAPKTFSINEWNLPNAEVLLQYEWTDGCATTRTKLRQCTPAAAAPVTPVVPAPGATPVAAPKLAEVRSRRLSLRGRRVTVTVKCTTGTGKACSARVRLRKRGKKLVTLASRKVRIKDGRSAKVRLTLSRKARKRIRSRSTRVRVEVDFGKKNGGKVTRNLTLRRR